MTPDGVLTSLFAFAGTNGAFPEVSLSQSSDGNFYGTTTAGGTDDHGTIFRISVPMPPVIRSLHRAGNTLTLAWSAVVGQPYQVQSNSGSASANWSNWGGLLSATNSMMLVTDVIGPDPLRMYRVVLLP
jgi:uncharacterized repeat protein (TIGR03803 family)